MLPVLHDSTESSTQMNYPKQDNWAYLEFREGTTNTGQEALNHIAVQEREDVKSA